MNNCKSIDNNTNKMDTFLEKHKLSKMTHK